MAAAPSRPKLHWFSPLPPSRTDIGQFTARILPGLAAEADVTLWTETRPPASEFYDLARIRYLQDGLDLVELQRADAIFYNLGNHGPFHALIQEAAWRVPGIVVLHEADLHHLLAYTWVQKQGRGAFYIAEMRRIHGEEGGKLARARLDGAHVAEALPRFPMLDPCLTQALGVICHTPTTEAAARRLDIPVLQAPLPFRAGPLQRESRREGPIRLLQFGFIGPHRRLEAALEAIARHPRRADFRFDIMGSIWDDALIDGVVERLGLGQQVTRHGFVDEPTLDAAVQAADMVFNLRHPTIGEASGTQLRIWNGAAPSVVTRLGWFGDLPDDCVLKLSVENEAAELDQLLTRLAQDRHAFDPLGAAGRARVLAEHAPEAYARIVLAAAAETPELRRRFGARYLMRQGVARARTQALLFPRADQGVAARLSAILLGDAPAA
jgi:glycosyltransferase involved in cell wall biosynthesis